MKNSFFFLFLFIFIASNVAYGAATIWGLSGGIEVPYPQIESGFSYSIIGDTKSFNYNKTLSSLMEISVIKSSNPAFLNDKIRINGKFIINRPLALFPGFCLGMYNLNMNKEERVLFFSAQSQLYSTGTLFTVGATKDDDGTVTPFYSVEQRLFSLTSLIVEKYRQKLNVGIRLTPFPTLNIDVFVLNWEDGHRQTNYNFSLMVRY